MKNKYVIIDKSNLDKWFFNANILAKSLCSHEVALKQFNRLDTKKRIEIKKQFDIYDDIRRKNMPNKDEEAYFTSVMIDANIIATEFNIDPLTAILCVAPPCNPNECILVI